jgi:hypothetical protein
VADRSDLVRNVGDALKTLLHLHRWDQPSTATPPGASLVATSAPPASATESLGPPPADPAETRHLGGRPGASQVRTVPATDRTGLGLDRRTVRTYVAMEQPPVYPPRRPRPTQLTPYLGYPAERWAQGCHNARRLDQELVRRGYRGSLRCSSMPSIRR